VFSPNVCPIAIPTFKGNICCLRSLVHSMSISLSTLTYHCDTSVDQAVKDVSASYDALVDLFESIGSFLSRLEIYTKIPLTEAMTDIVIKIMVEVLSTLALATKQVNQGRLSESCLRRCGTFTQRRAQRHSSRNSLERMRSILSSGDWTDSLWTRLVPPERRHSKLFMALSRIGGLSWTVRIP
jgi:hypothetical protein